MWYERRGARTHFVLEKHKHERRGAIVSSAPTSTTMVAAVGTAKVQLRQIKYKASHPVGFSKGWSGLFRKAHKLHHLGC